MIVRYIEGVKIIQYNNHPAIPPSPRWTFIVLGDGTIGQPKPGDEPTGDSR